VYVLVNYDTGSSVTVSDEEAKRLVAKGMALAALDEGILRPTGMGLMLVMLEPFVRKEEASYEPELARVMRLGRQHMEFEDRVLGLGRPGAWQLMETWRNAHNDRTWTLAEEHHA
jgi:hypothetical protein